MKLRAFFDGCGRVFIARDTDLEWLNERKEAIGIPTLGAVDDSHSDIVTPEDIEYCFRFAEKEFGVTPYQFIYIDDEVKDYCLDFDPYAQP